MKKLIIILLTLLVFSCATISGNFEGVGRGSDLVPLNSRALSGFLPNGLKYFILENSLPQNRAHLALIVDAGSVLEEDNQRGFAHFTEHLAFNDTARFPSLELIEYLRSMGMRFGADANAYTSYNETVYHFDIPVENVNGIKRIPDRALAILDDWTYAVSFKEEDVKNESRVILEEMRSRLGAMDRVRKITLPVLFKGSAFADRQPIGLEHIIENATSEQLRAFYDRWYASYNMALVFVGDFDGKALEAELAGHFNMPESKQNLKSARHELPPPKNGNFHVEIITDEELTSSSFMIYYKQKKSKRRGTIEYYRESVINYLIDTMLSMRFEETQLDPNSSASSSWGSIWRWSENSSFYAMGTSPKQGKIEDALKELLFEKEAVRRFGFTESELDRAKLTLVSYLEKMLSEKDRTESRTFIRGFTNHFLYGEDMSDIEWEVNAVNAMIDGIGLKEIAKKTRSYFSYNDINVFLIAPQVEEDILPSAQRIKEIFNETAKAKITRRQETAVSGDLMEKIPEAGEIVLESTDAPTGANIITLSNGAKVILKKTENRNNEIILYAIANGGSTNTPENTFVSVDLLSEMLNISGLGPYSKTELVNKLAGKQAKFSFWLSNYYRGFQGSCTTQDKKTLFEMIHLFFSMPRLDERAVRAMIDQYKTNLAHEEQDPQNVFSNELVKIINDNNPFFKPLELQDMDKVSTKQAEEFLKLCINPSDYTFVFTGNFDLDEIKELSAVYIASLTSENKSMNSWKNPGINRPSEIKRTIFKGKDERCIVYLGWFTQGPSAFSEQRNQVSAVLSEYLDIVLTDEIREKLGGVYSISAGASVSVIPAGEARLNIYFVCDPSRSEELLKAVKDTISDIFTKPLNTATFNKSKEALLMEHEKSVQTNMHIAQSYANSSVLYNTPLNRLNLRPNAIRAVTAQDIQALCRQILAKGPVEVKLMPESR
ncbi:MAG: insulinase family protein [Treponema sp.]|nr:insulinase family protein [Treponema sp.]